MRSSSSSIFEEDCRGTRGAKFNPDRAGTKLDKLEMIEVDSSVVTGWKSIFDFNHHRNESFASRTDYRIVLLILSAMDSRTSWLLSYLLAVHGVAAIVPFAIVTGFFAIPFIYLEIYLGSFAGTGSIWSIKNMVPLAGGIGLAMLIQSFVQLTDDTNHSHQLTIWSFRILRHHKDFHTCTNWWNEPRCTTLKNLSSCFQNQIATDCTELLKSHSVSQFLQKNHDRIKEENGIDYQHMLIALFLLSVIANLALLRFQNLAKMGKFVIVPAFLTLYASLLCSAIITRQSLEPGKAYNDIAGIFTNVTEELNSYDTWAKAVSLVFWNFAIAHGAYAATSRRSFQGDSIMKECIINVSITFISQILTAFIQLMALPVKPPLKETEGQEALFNVCTMPVLWILYSYETIELIGGGFGMILLIWILQIVRMLGKILIYLDVVRVGVIESYPDCNWSKLRPFLSLAIFAVMFLLTFSQYTEKLGYQMQILINRSVGAYVFRVIISCLLLFATATYGLRRLNHDTQLILGPKYAGASWAWVMTVTWYWTLLFMLISSGVLRFVSDIKKPFCDITITHQYQVHLLTLSLFIGGFIIAVVVLYAEIRIVQQEWSGKPIRILLRPTDKWGPCEIRFWKGVYRHLRYRYALDSAVDSEERAEWKRRRNAVKRTKWTHMKRTSFDLDRH